MRPPAISQLVNVTQSVMPTYMPTMTAQTTYPTMLTPTTIMSTAATYQQQQAAMLAALQLQQLSMYLFSSVSCCAHLHCSVLNWVSGAPEKSCIVKSEISQALNIFSPNKLGFNFCWDP